VVVLSADPGTGPDRVSDLEAEFHRGLTATEQTLLTWSDVPDRTVRTYEVLGAEDLDGPFERVNEGDQLSTATVLQGDSHRYYTVRAVDYWGRAGARSEVVESPHL
jgi:hypothetical protein